MIIPQFDPDPPPPPPLVPPPFPHHAEPEPDDGIAQYAVVFMIPLAGKRSSARRFARL